MKNKKRRKRHERRRLKKKSCLEGKNLLLERGGGWKNLEFYIYLYIYILTADE